MSEKYPTGVKVSHRAFSSDRVKLLKRLPTRDKAEGGRFKELLKELEKEAYKESSEGNFPGIIWDENEVLEEESSDSDDESNILNVGYKPIEMIVDTFENGHSILKSIPSGELRPQAFVEGSIEKIKKTASLVKTKFSKFKGIVRDWNEFLLKVPESDNADDYVRDHPLYIPFRKELFQMDEGTVVTTKDVAASKANQKDKDAEAEAKKKQPDIEIWRSLPCMTKKSKVPFERVRSIISENGKINNIIKFAFIVYSPFVLGKKTLVPFYEDVVEAESEASSEDEDIAKPRWCNVRRDTHINGYGDAASYIGMEFSRSGADEDSLATGLIDSVVKNKEYINGAQHFKLVSGSKPCIFVPCKIIMSTAKSNVYKVCNCIIFNL